MVLNGSGVEKMVENSATIIVDVVLAVGSQTVVRPFVAVSSVDVACGRVVVDVLAVLVMTKILYA